ncbi:RidA family protein [Streptomyces sp. SID11385]|uniref:RidA family protein n=1 Tax=Streptomyces sp. SID11385 TaxID=2706031 RepID=UPI0013C89DA7|nr:RidA family protein [Streptomyces sp. SID11385]NEA44302.1 RidA family protein [Streptomyces sp. SID11385]
MRRIHPPGLHPTPGYSHVTVAPAGMTAYLSGQCPLDAAGRLVGEGDVLAQTDQVVANALRALSAAGADPSDVVRAVVHVRTRETATLGAVWRHLRASALGPALTSAATLLGASALGYPGQLVEVDLTAALPAA